MATGTILDTILKYKRKELELQKKKVTNSKQFSSLIKEIIDQDVKTLYLAIYNSSNQRSYITVKLK